MAASGMSFTEKPPYYKNPTGKTSKFYPVCIQEKHRRRGCVLVLLKKVIDGSEKIMDAGVVHVTASDMGVLLHKDFGFRKNKNFMQYELN